MLFETFSFEILDEQKQQAIRGGGGGEIKEEPILPPDAQDNDS